MLQGIIIRHILSPPLGRRVPQRPRNTQQRSQSEAPGRPPGIREQKPHTDRDSASDQSITCPAPQSRPPVNPVTQLMQQDCVCKPSVNGPCRHLARMNHQLVRLPEIHRRTRRTRTRYIRSPQCIEGNSRGTRLSHHPSQMRHTVDQPGPRILRRGKRNHKPVTRHGLSHSLNIDGRHPPRVAHYSHTAKTPAANTAAAITTVPPTPIEARKLNQPFTFACPKPAATRAIANNNKARCRTMSNRV